MEFGEHVPNGMCSNNVVCCQIQHPSIIRSSLSLPSRRFPNPKVALIHDDACSSRRVAWKRA